MKLRGVVLGIALVIILIGGATAGPVIIGGDDLDTHGRYDGTQNLDGWLYIQKAISHMFEQGCITRPGNDGCIAALACPFSTWPQGEPGGAIHYAAAIALGRCVNNYEGATAINGFFSSLAAGTVNPAVIYLPSSRDDDGMTVAEGEALTAHAAEIKAFVNSGGGLMAHVDESPQTNGWLTTVVPGLVAHPNDCLRSGIAMTSAGQAAFPSLTNADLTAGPCHNTFTGDLNSLEVLATDGQLKNFILGGDCNTRIENEAPVALGFPPANQWTVCVGTCDTLSTSFIPPEQNQWTNTAVNLMGLWNATVTYTQGNPSTQTLIFCPSSSEIGDHVVRYTATDNGDPQKTTIVDLTIHVVTCPCSSIIVNGNFESGASSWAVLTPGDVTFPTTGGNVGGYARFFSTTEGWAGVQQAFTTSEDAALLRIGFQDYLDDFAPVAREVYVELDGYEIFRRPPVQGWRNESAFGVASAGSHTLSIWAKVHPSIVTKVDNVRVCIEPFCATDPPSGLVASYHCDGGPNDGQERDSSGRGNNANVYVATPFLATGAQFGSGPVHGTSLHFLPTNGAQEYSVPHSADLDMLAGMTGIACIRPRGNHTPDNTPGDCTTGTIFAKGGNYWFQIRQNNGAVEFQHEGSGAPGSYVSIAVPGGIPLDTWSHVAFVRTLNTSGDGYSVKLYYNGALLGQGDLDLLPNSNTATLTLGNYGFNGPGDCEFNGDIDEVKIWDRCLTDQQIQAEYAYLFLAAPPNDPEGRRRRRQEYTQSTSTSFWRIEPNPFTNAGVLVHPPESGEIDVRVFDVAGRLVRHLFTGVYGAERGGLFWDGRDLGGRQVSAGIYFVRMKALTRTMSTRIVRLN